MRGGKTVSQADTALSRRAGTSPPWTLLVFSPTPWWNPHGKTPDAQLLPLSADDAIIVLRAVKDNYSTMLNSEVPQTYIKDEQVDFGSHTHAPAHSMFNPKVSAFVFRGNCSIRAALQSGCLFATKIKGPHCQNTSRIEVSIIQPNSLQLSWATLSINVDSPNC